MHRHMTEGESKKIDERTLRLLKLPGPAFTVALTTIAGEALIACAKPHSYRELDLLDRTIEEVISEAEAGAEPVAILGLERNRRDVRKTSWRDS